MYYHVRFFSELFDCACIVSDFMGAREYVCVRTFEHTKKIYCLPHVTFFSSFPSLIFSLLCECVLVMLAPGACPCNF